MGLIALPSDRIEPAATPVRLSDEWVEKGLVLAVFGTWYATPSGMGRLVPTGNGVPNRGSVQGLVSGFGVTIAGNTNSYLTGPILGIPKTGFRSIVAHFYPRNAGAGGLGRLFQDITGTGLAAGHEAMYFSAGYVVHNSINSALTDSTQTRPSTAPTFDRWNSVGVVVDRSLAYGTVPTWYVDGKPSTGVLINSIGSAFSTQVNTFAFGNRPSDVGRVWDGYLGPTLFFDGRLNAADHRSLNENPWQAIQANVRRGFGVAVAGSSALAGNAAAIASATGALSTAISISGAAVGVTTATGALSTSMALSGAAAAVAVASGNLTLGLSLAGPAIANAVASGALGTQFGLAGAAQMAASATGTMQVQVTLSGSAIANAVATGNLVATGSSALAGDAQVQASASGILSTNLPLAGNAQVVAAASGNLTNGVPLVGAAVAVVTALGNVTVTVTLSGAAVANAIATGGMALSIPLAGAAIMQAIASGYLSVSGGAGPVGSVARAFSVLLEERESLIPPEQRLLILAAEFRQSSPAP